MPIVTGTTPVRGVRQGSTNVSRVYSGATLLFDGTASSTPAPVSLKPTSVTQSQMDSAVQTLWTNWKTHLREKAANGWWAVLANAQVDPVTGVAENPYVAEGQGYGLMLCAQMAPYDAMAKTYFDGITKFVLDHPSAIDPRLHAAQQDADMVTRGGGDSATDGDMDIAMGLLMGHERWGSAGTHNYLALAKTVITGIKESLVSPVTGLLELGDWSADYTASGGKDWRSTSRTSDWMIGHFEAFRAATGDTTWDTIRSTHITALARLQDIYAPTTGLVPDFTVGAPSTITPAPADTLEGPNDGAYYYNAARVPWRLGMAADMNSRSAAVTIATWAKTKAGGTPNTLPSGYQLDGTTIGNYQDLTFIAPMAVGAAAGSDQAWLNSLWDYMAANTGNTQYFSGSIQLLCMIHLSGTYAVTPQAPAAATVATVRSTASAAIPYNTTAKTIAKPSGTAAGDILLLFVHVDYGAAGSLTTPTGFTLLKVVDQGANLAKHLVAYKVAGASEPTSYTLNIPLDADARADILAVKDADTSVAPAVNTVNTPASNTSHSAPSVVPLTASGLVVCAVSTDATAAGRTYNWTPPAGMTERTDATTNGYVTLTTATQGWEQNTSTGTRAFALSTTETTAQAGIASTVVIPSKNSTSGGTVDDGTADGSGYTPVPSISGNGTGSYTDRIAVSQTFSGVTSETHILASAATPSEAAPLVIHLHGDGYQEYTNMKNGLTTSVAYDYRDVGRAHGAIVAIPRTPDTTTATWYTTASSTTWLVGLINNLKSIYKIDTNRIFFSGFSGGAEEITYWIMADHSNLMVGGGAMILGGGGADGLVFGLQPTTALKGNFPMRWFVGENDVAGATEPATWSARDEATAGEAFFRNAGFTKTSITIIPGTAHNDSEPYGPYYLNTVMNESNTANGLPTQSVTTVDVPPTSSTPVGFASTGSGGSGGSWTDAITTNRSFTDAAGTVGNYRAFVSHVTDRTNPMPLVIHLHGDGAYEYDNPTTWTSPLYMQVAKDIGGIGLIPQAMDYEYNLRSWWSGTRGADWVKNLINEMYRLYNIDKRQVYLSGFSGGAVIIAADIIPKYHGVIHGGAAMLLGGGTNTAIVGTPKAELKRDFPMHWHVGELDDGSDVPDGFNARAAAETGEAYYRGQGFLTKLTYIAGESHNASENDGPPAFRAVVNRSRGIYGKPTI